MGLQVFTHFISTHKRKRPENSWKTFSNFQHRISPNLSHTHTPELKPESFTGREKMEDGMETGNLSRKVISIAAGEAHTLALTGNSTNLSSQPQRCVQNDGKQRLLFSKPSHFLNLDLENLTTRTCSTFHYSCTNSLNSENCIRLGTDCAACFVKQLFNKNLNALN